MLFRSTAVFVGAGGELTPTGYVSAAVPAVLVGASVLLGSALLAALLPSGIVRREQASVEVGVAADPELVSAR